MPSRSSAPIRWTASAGRRSPSSSATCAPSTPASIPAESYAALAEPDDRLRAIAVLQQKAQSLEAEIAERKRAEQELRRKEAELRDFFENAVVGLHWVGPDGTILWANQAELDLLGYSAEEYVGRHIAEFHADPEVIDGHPRRSRGEGDPARLRGAAALQGRRDQARADQLERPLGRRARSSTPAASPSISPGASSRSDASPSSTR